MQQFNNRHTEIGPC